MGAGEEQRPMSSILTNAYKSQERLGPRSAKMQRKGDVGLEQPLRRPQPDDERERVKAGPRELAS